MQKRHRNPFQYINEQIISTQKHILPFIGSVKPIVEGMQVLEIGCGEAGNLKPFLDLGCICTGVDFSTTKIEKAKAFYASHPFSEKITLISEDIYKTNDFQAKFDVIILRDVIEHIHDQDKFLGLMKNLMAPDGIAFFAFPPWQNPFGGHQQMCNSLFLSVLPFFHLFPPKIYEAILKLFGEDEAKIAGLLDIKQTGISLDRFEKLILKNNYRTLKRTLYFINPNYEIKFGLKPRVLFGFLSRFPVLRNIVSTCGYYIITVD
ncbi:MAG: class I SAM-dependent methyltransferase [Paludibacter sp.]|nr:class I SAM-dependent methyltransferase [Paludibacter sp.]